MQDPINPSLYQTPQTPASAAGASTSSAPVTQTSMDMSVQPSKFSKFNLKQNKFKLKIVLPIILLFLVVGSVLAGMVLVQTSQDVRQQASGGGPNYSCGTGDDLFSDSVPNSAPCLWGGAPYYKCVTGYHNEDFGCKKDGPGASVKPSIRPSSVPSVRPSSVPSIRPSSLPTTVSQIGGQDPNSCGTGVGLFQSVVDFSVPCLWNGAPYYKCDDAKGYYNNDDYGCSIQHDLSTEVASEAGCGTEEGLFLDAVDFSTPCLVSEKLAEVIGGNTMYKCIDGYHNEDGGCAPNQVETYRVAGNGPYGLYCEVCPTESPCGLTNQECLLDVAFLYGKEVCYELGSCNLGNYVEAGTCAGYSSYRECQDTQTALDSAQMCWSLSSNCVIGFAPMGQTSCGVGEFPDPGICLEALAVQNSIFGPVIEALGSLSGASVGGE